MRSSSRRSVLLLGAAAPVLRRKAAAQGQYPSRPVQYVVPWPPGGSADTLGRILAQRFSTDLGQPFVVENRPGASGTIGHASVARSRPDGYTLLFATNSTYAIAPHLYENLPYENERAFVGIGLMARNPQSLCVHPSVPVRNFGEFLDYVRARPGDVTFSSAGIGATSHLATELLMSMAGLNMLHAPYRGGAPSAQAVLAGEVKMSFVDVVTALPFRASGQMRMLGISTAARSPLAADVPTLAEAGLPGFDSSTDAALFAPAGTPDAIVRQLNAALRAGLGVPETRQQILAQGAEPVGDTPEEFAVYWSREVAKWGEIVRARGIRMG